MKKIKSIGLASLRTEEDFGFMKLIVSETANLPLGGEEETDPATAGNTLMLNTAVDTFKEAVDEFDYALKASDSLESTATASEADAARDRSWRGINAYVDALCYHPQPELAEVAEGLQAIFDKYGDPTSLSQTEESGVLHNLLQDLDAAKEEKAAEIKQLGLEVWIDDLRAKETFFLAAVAVRTKEEAARSVGIVKQMRQSADTAYRQLADMVNLLASLSGEDDYATFIDHVNVIIDRQKAVLKSRATRRKEEEEEEASNV